MLSCTRSIAGFTRTAAGVSRAGSAQRTARRGTGRTRRCLCPRPRRRGNCSLSLGRPRLLSRTRAAGGRSCRPAHCLDTRPPRRRTIAASVMRPDAARPVPVADKIGVIAGNAQVVNNALLPQVADGFHRHPLAVGTAQQVPRPQRPREEVAGFLGSEGVGSRTRRC
jgi:hypothetical protein